MQITYNNLKLMFVTHAIKTRNDKHRARYAIKIRFYDLHNVQPQMQFSENKRKRLEFFKQ